MFYRYCTYLDRYAIIVNKPKRLSTVITFESYLEVVSVTATAWFVSQQNYMYPIITEKSFIIEHIQMDVRRRVCGPGVDPVRLRCLRVHIPIWK